LSIYDDYVDNDCSAYSRLERRHDYARLCADIEADIIKNVMAYRPDRLHRDTVEGETFLRACAKHHVMLYFHDGLKIDVSTPEGAKVFRDLVSAAQFESAKQSRRGIDAAQDYASQGLLNGGGGDRPYGYEDDRLTIRESEARVIRILADRCDAGESLRSLVLWMNSKRAVLELGLDPGLERVPTVRGGLWTVTVLRTVLHSARISGLCAYKGEIVATAEWPGIIKHEQGDRIRARLESRRRLEARAPRRYLLTGGRSRCGRCRTGLVARPKMENRPNYVCPKPPGGRGCGRISILAAHLEGEVVDRLLRRLDSPALWEALQHPEKDDPQAELAEQVARKRQKLEETDQLWRGDQLSREQYLRNSQILRAEIDQLLRRLSRTSRVVVLRGLDSAARLKARWEEIGVERQQAICDVVIDHVTVLPARHGCNRPDPRRVEITWKV
jgi:DNA invertase Pin-like site-specific DNA recombinase